MYRLLIVDDEELIVEWLHEMFQNNKDLDLDIYLAYSGSEAIEWMNKAKIDIVLTDIRMPGIDGMELLKRIRANWPDCRIIFLTGYDDFQYVYTAIQNKGVRYLLKTEDDDAIIGAVKDSIADIEKGLQMENLISEAQKQIQAALPLLQKEYLEEMLMGNEMSTIKRKEQFMQLEIPLNAEEPVLLLLSRIDNADSASVNMDKSQVAYSIKAITDQCLSHYVNTIHVILDNTLIVWFIQPVGLISSNRYEQTELWERTILYVKETLESIQSASKRLLRTSLSFVLDNETAVWERVGERFDELRHILYCCIGLGTERIITSRELPFSSPSVIPEEYTQTSRLAQAHLKKINRLNNLLESGQRKAYFELLSELAKFLREITNLNNNTALEVYYSISLMLLSYINRWNVMEKAAFKIGLYKLTRADEHVSWSHAVEYLYSLSEILFDIQKEDQENRSIEAVSLVKKYIQENISDDLSTVALAELVHFNPSYLSRLFKQITGENLSDYIAKARLDTAKELLSGTDMKIHAVGKSIGYESASYFNRFFKKYSGMTPQEYRLSFIGRQNM